MVLAVYEPARRATMMLDGRRRGSTPLALEASQIVATTLAGSARPDRLSAATPGPIDAAFAPRKKRDTAAAVPAGHARTVPAVISSPSGARLVHADAAAAGQRGPDVPVRELQIEPLRVEVATGPRPRIAVLGMPTIGHDLQKARVAVPSPNVLGRAGATGIKRCCQTGRAGPDDHHVPRLARPVFITPRGRV